LRYNEWSRFAEESRHATVEQFAPEVLQEWRPDGPPSG
jgi:hypothetical protein